MCWLSVVTMCGNFVLHYKCPALLTVPLCVHVQVERKMKTTVLSAALLLSGIPAEVISRSAETYRTMGDVFSDLCVYFFTFITCHEIITAFSSQST